MWYGVGMTTTVTAPKPSEWATLTEALEAAKRTGGLLHAGDAGDELRDAARVLVWGIERAIALWHVRTAVAGIAKRLVGPSDETVLWRVDVIVPEDRLGEAHRKLTENVPGGFHVLAYDDDEGLREAYAARLGVFVVSTDD